MSLEESDIEVKNKILDAIPAPSTGVPDVNGDPEPAETQDTDDAAGDSSPPDDKKSLLDVLKNVVNPDGEGEDGDDGESGEEGSSTSKNGEDGSDSADGEDGADKDKGADKSKDEEEEQPPFHEHPRWKAVVKERNEARDQVTALTGDAGQYREIQQFVQANGLSDDEVVTGYRVMANLRNNPAEAFNVLAPIMDDLNKLMGNGELPADLQEEIESGGIDEAMAQRIHRAEASQGLASHNNVVAQQRQVRDQQLATHNSMLNSVAAWEVEVVKTDPEYAAKRDMIRSESARLQNAEGPPGDSAQAVALITKAHANVTASLKKMMPAPSSTHRRKVSSDNQSDNNREAPAAKQTMKSIMAARLLQMRNGAS